MNLQLLHNTILQFIAFYLTLNYRLQAVAAIKYNVSLAQLETCKEHNLRDNGYAYLQFFHIPRLDNNKLNDNERLHLKFYVMAAMDAHILLAVNDTPRMRDRVYEVVIGAGQNTFSTIRIRMGAQRVSTNQDSQILSAHDPTPIEIIQTKDGKISVYIPGFKEEPLLNYTDSAPLQINYISFSTFGSTTAKWFYDCKFDGFAQELDDSSRPKTPLQLLLGNITEKAENRSMPNDLASVNFSFEIRSVSYNHANSILHTRLHLQMYWQDARLKWNPKDFKGIDIISDPDLDIWTPDMIVLNGAYSTMGHFNPAHELIIYANGSVTWFATNVELTTWCVDRKQNWPHERLMCGLILGLENFSPYTNAPLRLVYDFTGPLSVKPINMLSEWLFKQVSLTILESDEETRYNERAIAQTLNGDISLEFMITRNGVFYKNVFTMPILTCETLLVLSFLLRGYRRGGLILVVFVVLSLALMFVTRHAPSAYIPNTMHAYRHVLRITTFCYLLHVVLMWLEMYPPKAKPTFCLMTLLNLSWLRFLLCMRMTDGNDFVEMQSHPWRELAKLLNNLCFIIISALFIIVDIVLMPDF